jgi:hypothetical protein
MHGRTYGQRLVKGTGELAGRDHPNEIRSMRGRQIVSGPLAIAKCRDSARFSIGSAENL